MVTHAWRGREGGLKNTEGTFVNQRGGIKMGEGANQKGVANTQGPAPERREGTGGGANPPNGGPPT